MRVKMLIIACHHCRSWLVAVYDMDSVNTLFFFFGMNIFASWGRLFACRGRVSGRDDVACSDVGCGGGGGGRGGWSSWESFLFSTSGWDEDDATLEVSTLRIFKSFFGFDLVKSRGVLRSRGICTEGGLVADFADFRGDVVLIETAAWTGGVGRVK